MRLIERLRADADVARWQALSLGFLLIGAVLDLLRREERRDGARVLPPRLEAVELRHDGVLGLEVAADEGMGRHGRVGRACV